MGQREGRRRTWGIAIVAVATIALGSSAARADMASAYAGTVTSSAQVSNASDATGMENSTCATTTGFPSSIVLTNFGFALPA